MALIILSQIIKKVHNANLHFVNANKRNISFQDFVLYEQFLLLGKTFDFLVIVNLHRCFQCTSEYYTNETGTSKARWYILFIISSYAALQYCIWNTFGPIASSIKKSFNWDNGDVATLANWDTLIFILLSLQVCWLIEKRGKYLNM